MSETRIAIDQVAKIFSDMQQLRLQLICGAQPRTRAGEIRLRLAQMLDEMKDAGKDKFLAITSQ